MHFMQSTHCHSAPSPGEKQRGLLKELEEAAFRILLGQPTDTLRLLTTCQDRLQMTPAYDSKIPGESDSFIMISVFPVKSENFEVFSLLLRPGKISGDGNSKSGTVHSLEALPRLPAPE